MDPAGGSIRDTRIRGTRMRDPPQFGHNDCRASTAPKYSRRSLRPSPPRRTSKTGNTTCTHVLGHLSPRLHATYYLAHMNIETPISPVARKTRCRRDALEARQTTFSSFASIKHHKSCTCNCLLPYYNNPSSASLKVAGQHGAVQCC